MTGNPFAPDDGPAWRRHPHAPAPATVLGRLGEIEDPGVRVLAFGAGRRVFSMLLVRRGDTVRAFLDAYMPGKVGRMTKGQVCMYTLTPDKHFVIDLHPRFPQVAVACGFSGHGFKFASVVGEILADLAERGRTEHPIGMFGAGRFG